MMNTSRIIVFKKFVMDLATLSHCEDRQVAAIITDDALTQIYSIGINGGPKGLNQCMCHTEGKYGCIHAEINALIKCTTTDPDKAMFVTLSPCKQCAAAIINAGIKTVYYVYEWKDNTGINILKQANIKVLQI